MTCFCWSSAIGSLAPLQERVASQGDDDPHMGLALDWPSVATMTALIVWSRFSA